LSIFVLGFERGRSIAAARWHWCPHRWDSATARTPCSVRAADSEGHRALLGEGLEVGVLGGEHHDEEQADGVAAHAKCLRVRQTCETRKCAAQSKRMDFPFLSFDRHTDSDALEFGHILASSCQLCCRFVFSGFERGRSIDCTRSMSSEEFTRAKGRRKGRRLSSDALYRVGNAPLEARSK